MADLVEQDPALGVGDVGLVHRPGVHQRLDPVGRVVDRPAVEAQRLGLAVGLAGRDPGPARGVERGGGGGALELAQGLQELACGDLGLGVGARARRLTPKRRRTWRRRSTAA